MDLKDLTTNESGEVLVQKLKHGKYFLEQTSCPKHYFIPEDQGIIEFEVDEDGFLCYEDNKYACLSLSFKCLPINVDISVNDKDNGNALANAELLLKDQQGNKVDTWTSNAEPKLFTNLLPGIYCLEEVNAPNGYEKPEALYFDVEDIPDRQSIVLENELANKKDNNDDNNNNKNNNSNGQNNSGDSSNSKLSKVSNGSDSASATDSSSSSKKSSSSSTPKTGDILALVSILASVALVTGLSYIYLRISEKKRQKKIQKLLKI